MTVSRIGDAFRLPEPIKLDAYWRERRTVRRLLEGEGVNVRRCQFYNRGIFTRGLIVQVQRGHGQAARAVLAQNGYSEVPL